MKLLLDTHAALWFAQVDTRLTEHVRARIRDPDNVVLVSAVVVLEIAIKRSLGKLGAPVETIERLLDGGARSLPVSLEHAARVEHLPLHHRDPFDRLLLAQAQLESAVLISGDPAMRPYGVPILW